MEPGTRLGPYEIDEPLGKGGMGEVYRARDTKLDREVAIKVLPAELADDPQRLARLEREARLLASLNHANIASIYGLEETGEGRPALVLELVEGPTLANRIAEGPIPVEEALGIALQVAGALEVAHDRGIVHRDLKPANVKVGADGTVKVLDFGLAKALEDDGAEELADSPTLSVAATRAGIILGTAGYMSPEQAKGKGVDRRADIWAFGVVLLEMLTGERAFEGETVSETLAAVIKDEPDFDGLPPETPVRVRELLERCLEKGPRQRLQAIGEARIALEAVLADPDAATLASVESGAAGSWSGGEAPGGRPSTGPAWSRRALSLPLALLLAAAAGLAAGAAVWLGSRPEPTAQPVHRFRVAAPRVNATLASGNSVIGISPDGRRIAYLVARPDGPAMMQRLVGELEGAPIPGAGFRAFFPRYSPDGRWLLVSNLDGLYRIAAFGGEPLLLAKGTGSVFPMGVWADSDTVVFSDGKALWRIGAVGGQPEPLGELPSEGRANYYLNDLVPGNRYALLEREDGPRVDVVVADVETGEIVAVVAEGVTTARFVPSGHVVFARGEVLEAVAFDPDTARVLGTPVPLVDGVHAAADTGVASYAVSDTGTLVYVPADASSARYSLVWVDRDGSEAAIRAFEGFPPVRPRLSPDGRRVAMESRNPAADVNDIRVWDLERGGSIQLTHGGMNYDAVWTPDGEHIVYSSVEDGFEALFQRRADGLGPAEPIPGIDRNENPYSFGPDGAELATYARESTQGDRDIFVRSVRDGWERRPILATEFNERSPALSPDGRWLAYASDESGQDEVYVIRYPEIDRKYPISTDGGREPAWSADGTELYYRRDDDVFAVTIRQDPGFRADPPVRLFGGPYRREFSASGSRSYDVSADGRFLMMRSDTLAEATEGEIVVVLNWLEELRRLVPGTD